MISKVTFKTFLGKNWVLKKFESFIAKKSLNFPGLEMRSHRPICILNVAQLRNYRNYSNSVCGRQKNLNQSDFYHYLKRCRKTLEINCLATGARGFQQGNDLRHRCFVDNIFFEAKVFVAISDINDLSFSYFRDPRWQVTLGPYWWQACKS